MSRNDLTTSTQAGRRSPWAYLNFGTGHRDVTDASSAPSAWTSLLGCSQRRAYQFLPPQATPRFFMKYFRPKQVQLYGP